MTTITETRARAVPDAALLGLLRRSVAARRERLVRLRRRIHAIPEPSGEERATTRLVADALRELGLEPRVMADDVGVVADVPLGGGCDSSIALRSEIDCVRVGDEKQVPYASTRPGLCHACGHDVHTAILLAVAAVLIENREALLAYGFRHDIRLIFQPAEETAVGARSMITQGALDRVEGIIALHVDPLLDVGQIGLRTGPITSACEAFEVVVRGRSGHSARPYEAVDPIPAATSIVDLMYQLGPRSMDGRYPLSLSVSSIQSGTSFNAIPDRAVIRGTLRAARAVDIEAVQKRMEAVVRGASEATGCDVSLEFVCSCPATDNDPRIIDEVTGAAAEIVGADGVIRLEVPSLGAEDFAHYQELIPGAIVRLGAALADPRARRPLHSSQFDVNEDALAVGADVLGWSALRLAASFTGQRE